MHPPAFVLAETPPTVYVPAERDTDDDEWIGYESAYPLPAIPGMPWMQQETN